LCFQRKVDVVVEGMYCIVKYWMKLEKINVVVVVVVVVEYLPILPPLLLHQRSWTNMQQGRPPRDLSVVRLVLANFRVTSNARNATAPALSGKQACAILSTNHKEATALLRLILIHNLNLTLITELE
jgi:hypothetical protein